MNRRRFCQLVGGGALAAAGGKAGAIEPLVRPGKPRMPLSLAAYSFREFFVDGREGNRPLDPARQLDMRKFIDYCADHGCAGAEVTSYYFPRNVTPEYLLELRRHAFLRGIAISGTAVGNTFTVPAAEKEKRQAEITGVKTWIDRAALLGAPHVRVFAGAAGKLPLAEAKKLCLAALEECAAYAGSKGIFLGIENHGGIVTEADDLL